MTVATKTQPNYTTQAAASYKAAIDAITAVHDRLAGAFAPHEQDVGSPSPDLSIRIDAGFILNGVTLTEKAAQTVSGFTTPSAGQERIDRVVIDPATGTASRVAGTAVTGSPSATAPAIPAGFLPCCQVRFTSSNTAVLNSMITDERVAFAKNSAYPPGHLNGLTMSNNGSDATNDIDIAAGTCRDSTDTVDMILSAALTKRLDAAWSVGTGNGGLDTGAIANTTYHIWLIKRSDTGVVDALFSTSASAPTMPSNYDYKRRIGSIVRASAAILAFSQNGDEFLWNTPVLDINASNPGTAAVLRTLTVPAGIKVDALFRAANSNGSPGVDFAHLYSSPDVADGAPSPTAAPLLDAPTNATVAGGVAHDGGSFRVRTNTSAQIRTRAYQSDASCTLRIATYGFIDTRGRV